MASSAGSGRPEGIREAAFRLVEGLPADATWDDLMRVVYECVLIEERLAESEAGRVVPLDEVEREFGLIT